MLFGLVTVDGNTMSRSLRHKEPPFFELNERIRLTATATLLVRSSVFIVAISKQPIANSRSEGIALYCIGDV